MQHVLRAISGPQAGAVYVLGDRTVIGRASDCEIQVLHEGVSRHHARITRDEDGRMTLLDLSSDNGTFIESERVDRHVLVAGDVVRIMRSRFAYEVLHGTDATTSVVFRRKVTSGDSLRQTVGAPRSLAPARSGMAQGLPGRPVGERARAYSRPQAAAPALSGARPGAAGAGRSTGAETRSRTRQYPALEPEGVVEPPSVRRPTPTTPPRVDEPAGAERWPQAGRAALATRDALPPAATGAETALLRRTPLPGRARPGLVSQPLGNAGVGGPAPAEPGRRERSPSMPGSLGRSSGRSTTAARLERSSPQLVGPSGRMAPPGPAAAAAPMDAPLGGGWVRVPRPVSTPGSMRPGATLCGIPRIDEPTPAVAPTTPVEAAAERRGITAEYGAVGRPRSMGDTSGDTIGDAIETASTTGLAAAPVDSDAELDAMTTVPAVRRSAKPRGSTTPTEEVPRVIEERVAEPSPTPTVEPEVDDDERDTKTQPRVTLLPRPAAHERRPLAYEDTLRFQRDEASDEGRATAGPDDVEERAPVDRSGEQWQRLLDILEYRRLRGDALRGQPLPEAAIERRAELERSLQPRLPAEDERAALRRYHRFACSIPAWLGPPLPGPSAPIPASVELEDVSAGGARITVDQRSLAVGERVWLTIDLDAIERSRLPSSTARQVVLDARVIWAQPHRAALGLAFVGVPRYRDEASDPTPT